MNTADGSSPNSGLDASESSQDEDFFNSDFDFDFEEATSKDEALDAVQLELSGEKDARREERFYWICLVVFLFDLFYFKDMETWSAPLVIGFLQFVVLIALGRKLGVDSIWTLTEKFFSKWDGKIGGGS